jgi:hypothetical protein
MATLSIADVRARLPSAGFHPAAFPGPCAAEKAKASALIGDLVEAVRRESAVAVQYWWGVGADTVWKWRQALGVGRNTDGTRLLKGEYSREARFNVYRAKAWVKARDPDRCAKIAAAKRGKPRPPHVAQAVIKAHLGHRHSKAARRRMSEAHRRRGTGPPKAGRTWAAAEDALLRSLPAQAVAERTGRTLAAVYSRRHELNLPDDRRMTGRNTQHHGGDHDRRHIDIDPIPV